MKDYTWHEADAQFLEAILLATGGESGAPLQEVLLMADAIDGMVYTLKEVEEALEKLVAVQFVSIQKNKLALTPGFLQQYEAITLKAGLTESSKPLIDLLRQQPITEETIKLAKEGELKKYKLKNYYQQYQEQFG